MGPFAGSAGFGLGLVVKVGPPNTDFGNAEPLPNTEAVELKALGTGLRFANADVGLNCTGAETGAGADTASCLAGCPQIDDWLCAAATLPRSSTSVGAYSDVDALRAVLSDPSSCSCSSQSPSPSSSFPSMTS